MWFSIYEISLPKKIDDKGYHSMELYILQESEKVVIWINSALNLAHALT